MTALDFNATPQESLVALKSRVDIVEIAQRFVRLKRSGQDWLGCCPMHADRTPSFQVSSIHQNFRCWGCGAHGDVFDLVAAIDGVDPSEAIRRVRDLVAGSAPDPAAMAARAARMAAAAALEARETKRRVALAQTIFHQSE